MTLPSAGCGRQDMYTDEEIRSIDTMKNKDEKPPKKLPASSKEKKRPWASAHRSQIRTRKVEKV